MAPSLDEMYLFAATVWHLGRHEPMPAQQALAWLIKRRTLCADRHNKAAGHSHPVFGDGSLSAACRSLAQTNHIPLQRIKPLEVGFADRDLCRLFSLACLVINNDVGDNITGATHFHHHRQEPAWSHGHRPVALMGSFFFYNTIDRTKPGLDGSIRS